MAAGQKAASPQGGPSLKRQLIFWAVAFVVFVFLLWLLSDVLLPFVVGLCLAYFLDPVVVRLERLGLNRAIGAMLILVLAILAVTAAFFVLVPILAEQFGHFMERLPGYIEQLRKLAAQSNQTWIGRYLSEKLPEAQRNLGGLAGQAASWAAAALASLWTGGKALVSLISLIVITPVVAFYILLDWNRMVETIDRCIPRQHQKTVKQLLRDVDSAVAGFMRGQALCSLILGVFYSVGLILVGLNFGLLIGLVAGALSFIPYVGTIVGFLLAGGVALAQFWPDYIPILMAIGVFVAGQLIEGNILQPYLVGARIGLHPVWLMFSLLAFGYLFGFVGLLIAVPVAAALGVLVRFLLRQYLTSAYYTGG